MKVSVWAKTSALFTVCFLFAAFDGHGQVSFYKKDTLNFSHRVSQVLTSDYNLDSYPDLVYIKDGAFFWMQNFAGDSIGNAEKAFSLPYYHVGEYDQIFLVKADFDNDGYDDFFYPSFNPQELIFLFGSAEGLQQQGFSFPTLLNYQIRVTDFDGDGDSDILNTNGTNFILIENTGNRTFVTRSNILNVEVGSDTVWDFVVTDFNRNEQLDLVLLRRTEGENLDMSINVYLDFGSNISEPEYTASGYGNFLPYLRVGDVNLDGYPDIVVDGSEKIESYLYSETEIFTRRSTPVEYRYPSDNFILFDYNLDGRLDVVGNKWDTDIGYFSGKGDGTFADFYELKGDVQSGRISVADFNKDGVEDMLVQHGWFNSLHVYIKGTDNKISRSIQKAYTPHQVDLSTADLDGDGITDIIVLGQNGAAHVSWGSETTISDEELTQIKVPLYAQVFSVADLNLDGIHDLIVTVETPSNGYNSYTFIAGKGDRKFASPVELKYFPEPDRAVVVDLFHDGIPEMLCRQRYNSTHLYLLTAEQGVNEYYLAPKITPSFSTFHQYEVSDLNNDGFSDLIFTSEEAGGISIFANNGVNDFGAEQLLETSQPHLGLAVADFNNDQLKDIIVSTVSDTASELIVYLGKGNFVFESGLTISAEMRIGEIIAGDFDNNGLPDLLLRDNSYGSVQMAENLGGTSFRLFDPNLYKTNVHFLNVVRRKAIELPEIYMSEYGRGIVYVAGNNSVYEITSLTSEVQEMKTTSESARLTLNLTPGKKRLVIAKEASPVDFIPADGTFYARNPNFGIGQQLGEGNFVVYSGDGVEVNIQKLKPVTNYHLAIFEYSSNEPDGTIVNYFQSQYLTLDFTTDRIEQKLVYASKSEFSYAEGGFSANITTNSQLPIVIEPAGGPVTVAGTTVTFSSPGEGAIRATQAGNDLYAPADTTFHFIIHKIPQQFTAEGVHNRLVNEESFAIDISSDAGLPVTIELISGPVTREGNMFRIDSLGEVSIRAFQEGNELYAAAEQNYVFNIIGLLESTKQEIDEGVKIYPVPANAEVTLLYPSGKYSSLSIFTLSGENLLTQAIEGVEATFNVATAKAGILLIVLKGKNHYSIHRLIRM